MEGEGECGENHVNISSPLKEQPEVSEPQVLRSSSAIASTAEATALKSSA